MSCNFYTERRVLRYAHAFSCSLIVATKRNELRIYSLNLNIFLKVTKRDGDSSLMQLKEEFRTYETLRREHDAQIVQIATEAGLRIAPDQWSSLLYGN